MTSNTIAIIAILIIIIIIAWLENRDLKKHIELLFKEQDRKEDEFINREKEIRKEAITSSKSVIRGQLTEEILPLFPDFPYLLQDCRFSGQPIDYLVFEGMTEYKEGELDKELTIIIADVKTRKSRNTGLQKKIKEAIEAGRVKFEEWKVDEHNKLTIK